MSNAADLLKQKCRHQVTALNAEEIAQRLQAVSDWKLQDEKVVREFTFPDYYDTLAFVNAITTIIHAEDHHPELVITYNRCIVKFNTHSVNDGKGGLSDNDFICAAKLNAVFERSFA